MVRKLLLLLALCAASAFSADRVFEMRTYVCLPGKLEALKTRVESDARLGLEVKRETTYYDEQSQGLALFISVLGIMIAVFFSVGAMIGAMITMYAQVAQRDLVRPLHELRQILCVKG